MSSVARGQSLFDAIMLALTCTLILSFTAVLALDVPAEVNKADMVDFGGRVLRKSGLVIDYMVGQRVHLESRSKAAHNSVIKGILPI